MSTRKFHPKKENNNSPLINLGRGVIITFYFPPFWQYDYTFANKKNQIIMCGGPSANKAEF